MDVQNWQTKRDYVINALRQAIMNGEYSPGEHLSLEVLSNRFNVSQTPVREALRELQYDGLVDSEPHKGVWVRNHSIEDTYQVFSIRAHLEIFAARLAMANLQEEDIAKFNEYTSNMVNANRLGDADAVRAANHAFHFHVYRLTGWPKLQSIMQSLWLQMPWSMLRLLPGRTPQSVAEHEQILQAIIDRDTPAVEKLLSQHVLAARDALVSHIGRPKMLLNLDLEHNADSYR